MTYTLKACPPGAKITLTLGRDDVARDYRGRCLWRGNSRTPYRVQFVAAPGLGQSVVWLTAGCRPA